MTHPKLLPTPPPLKVETPHPSLGTLPPRAELPPGTPRNMVMGVDPGLSGAVALVEVHPAPMKPTLVGVWDMPTRHTKTGKRLMELNALAVLVDGYAKDIHCAVVEEIGAMPRDGKVQAMQFGLAAGGAAGVIAGCFVATVYVRPAVWKGLMGLSADKDLSRRMAIAAFPDHAHQFARKKDDGRAEAALLALFGTQRLMELGE